MREKTDLQVPVLFYIFANTLALQTGKREALDKSRQTTTATKLQQAAKSSEPYTQLTLFTQFAIRRQKMSVKIRCLPLCKLGFEVFILCADSVLAFLRLQLFQSCPYFRLGGSKS